MNCANKLRINQLISLLGAIGERLQNGLLFVRRPPLVKLETRVFGFEIKKQKIKTFQTAIFSESRVDSWLSWF